MTLFRARGVVLRTTKLGESHRILSIVTDGRGKVRAVAKGVRKTKSRWGARLEPLSHISMMCWEGRELDIVTQAEVIDTFRPVREDLDRMAKAAILVESVDRLSQEGEADPTHYRMLVGALKSLAEADSPALVGAFLWRLLAHQGASPILDQCAACGSDGPLVAFNLADGGTVCRSCRQGRPVSPAAIALMSEMLRGRLGAVLAAPATPATSEVEALATHAIEAHIERRLRSIGVLDRG